MYYCDEKEIVKFQADFDEDFDNTMLEILGNCKRLYFLDSIGFGIMSKQSFSKFNRSVNLLPQNLTHIKFGYAFNQPVDNLPFNLIWLEFGYVFNQPIDMLPNSITYLVFGEKFNNPIDNLPNCLEFISFGSEFNKSIDCLPEFIFYINIGTQYSGSKFNAIIHKLPNKINNVSIYKNKNCKVFKFVIKSDFENQLNELIEKHNYGHQTIFFN